jgi:hypothetical protein
MLSLDGISMFVSSTAANGVAQREVSGAIHHGHSVGHIERRTDGGIRIVEHFTWSSRPGSGTNVFDELSAEH